MRKVIWAAVVGVFAVVAWSAGAGAQGASMTIDVNGVAAGPQGSTVVMARETVDPALVGSVCTVSASTANNASEHQGNNLIVASGADSVTIFGFEDDAGQTTSASGTMVLGPDVTASVQFGPDEITSGGVTLSFSCEPPPPTTTAPPTTTSPPTTTAPPTTTSPPTTTAPTEVEGEVIQSTPTTTAPAPSGGIDAGQGGTATGTDGGGGPELGYVLIGLGLVAVSGAGVVVTRRRWSA